MKFISSRYFINIYAAHKYLQVAIEVKNIFQGDKKIPKGFEIFNEIRIYLILFFKSSKIMKKFTFHLMFCLQQNNDIDLLHLPGFISFKNYLNVL